MKFELQGLAYDFDALEPYIDAKTMEIHHGKHHAGYTNNLNNLCEEHGLEATIEELLGTVSTLPDGVRNNAGGYYNHNIFWQIMTPGGSEITDDMSERVAETFGGIDEFKAQFKESAMTKFGSGWAWLCANQSGDLMIMATSNQDNPLMDIIRNNEGEWYPILCVDVWEHAYYLSYQNKRADYIDAFWNVVDWGEVERRYGEIVV